MNDYNIILKPVVTEKSTTLKNDNKYVFIVHKNANKISIEKEIKNIFKISPLNINIINVRGKRKRVRYKYGYTSSYKKAIVTVKKGDKITIFEGA